MNDPIVRVENVTKSFKTMEALRGVSFDLDRGEILGFIGPNGAGKTTTIRILAGLLRPTSGRVTIDGVSVTDSPRETRSMVGYMPDFVGFYDNTTVAEFLQFFASAQKIPRKERAATIDSVLELTDLSRKKNAEMAHLSRGMSQRASLARSLLHDPKVLLLDEPASGIDPRGRIEMRALLKELSKMGKAILISSHILTELSDLCSEVVILETGNVLASGSPKQVVKDLEGISSLGDGQPAIILRLTLVDRIDEAITRLREIPSILKVICVEDRMVECVYSGSLEEASEIVEIMVRHGFKVMSFVEKEVDLEELFLRVTKGDLN